MPKDSAECIGGRYQLSNKGDFGGRQRDLKRGCLRRRVDGKNESEQRGTVCVDNGKYSDSGERGRRWWESGGDLEERGIGQCPLVEIGLNGGGERWNIGIRMGDIGWRKWPEGHRGYMDEVRGWRRWRHSEN